MNLEKRLEELVEYIGLDLVPAEYVEKDFLYMMKDMDLEENKDRLKMQVERSLCGYELLVGEVF